MNIIAYPNNMTNYVSFLKNIDAHDYIQGIYVHVVESKDGVIMAYINPPNELSVDVLQSSIFSDLDKSSVVELDRLLRNFQGWPKRIVMGVIPLITLPLSEYNIDLINQKNWEYVSKIKTIVDKYNNLDISLHSTNRILVDYMNSQLPNRKIGWELSFNDLNYLNTSYYVLPPKMLDEQIILQQLQIDKEIMVKVIGDNQMMLVFDFFKTEQNPLRDQIFNNITFICDYPNMFYELFKDKAVNRYY